MTLLHTALLCEAQPIIERFRLKKIDGFYINNSIKNDLNSPNFVLKVGGVGAKNTKNALLSTFEKFSIKFALNLGVCGSSDKNIKIGSIFCTNKNLVDFLHKNIQSVKHPNEPINTTLCDMESDEFIKICKEKNIEHLVLKVVSDYQDTDKLDKNFVYNLIKAKISDIVLAIKSFE